MPAGETISFILASFSALIILIIIPMSILIYYNIEDEKQMEEDDDTMHIFDLFKHEMRVETPSQRLYFLIFMLRRLIYLSVGLIFYGMTMTLQIQSIMALNIANIIYIAQSEPNKSRLRRRVELFNDFMI